MTKFKILTIAFLIFIFNVKAFALDANYKNALKEIDIQKNSQKGYLINLIFEKSYQEPLALKKKTPGEYTILLPETRLASDNVSVLYEAGKGLIDFNITQNSYLDESINNGYVKITVSTKKSIPLSIASGIAIKTNLEEIKKDDVKTIVPKTDGKPVATQTADIAPIASEDDINVKTIEAAAGQIEIPEVQTQMQMPTEKQTIQKKLIKKAVNLKHRLAHKDLLKLGFVGLIILAAIGLITKMLNNQNGINESKFAAERGVIKRTPDQRKTNIEDIETDEGSSPISYSPNAFGKMSQRSSYQDTTPESALKRISTTQSTEQPTRIEPAIQQDAVVKNQSNPFVTKNAEQEPTVIETKTQESQIAEAEEEIREEAFNPDYPELISQVRISKNKGLYLVNYDDQYSLLGYINDKIFVIKKFETITNKKLQVRVNAKTEKSTTYIVRLDSYKALLDVSASNMKTLIEF